MPFLLLPFAQLCIDVLLFSLHPNLTVPAERSGTDSAGGPQVRREVPAMPGG